MKKILGIIGLAVLVGGGGFAAWTWPYPKLLANSLSGPPVSVPDAAATREPLETVAGDYRPLPRAENQAFDFSAAEAINQKYDGYSLLIWHNGAVIFERYYNGGDSESRTEPASMHKSVMASLMGVAIAEGHVKGLDEPVAPTIPEWANDPRGQITVRNVLNMATGLEPLSPAGGPLSPNARFSQGLFMRGLTLGRKLIHPPGSVFDYRNPNSQMGGLIIEAATQRRYADYLSEKIWKPLGAKDAYVWLDKPGGTARTANALLARAEDWLRVGIMLKDKGEFEGKRILPAAWVDEMTAPSARNPNYGLQVWRASPYVKERWYNEAKVGAAVPAAEPWADPEIFFFDGFGGQRVYVSRAHDLVIARLGKPRMDWDDSALPNAVIAALEKAKTQ
ncbi:MAG: serine hydrolase [Rhodospirillaceae bacterium]|nr:serine hydrolase [Rhodospirillaceae bacterium]